MSAEIIDFVAVRAARVRKAAVPAFAALAATSAPVAEGGSSFQFWTGASGACYVHSIYGLFECPPFEAANYLLVKRHEGGRRTVLSIGRAAHAAASLNLADIRQRSAELGANEIHIHLLAGGNAESQRIESDLRRAHALP